MTTIDFSVIERAIVSAATPTSSPVLVHSLGIPGCGKSSLFKILEKNWYEKSKSSPTLLGFDQVMQSHPDYQAYPDKIAAFDKFELPAREAGYRVLDKLLEKRAHILFDNGGSADSHPALLRRAQHDFGYKVILISIFTPVSISASRVDLRAEQTGQHTPMHYLQERFDKLQKLLPEYKALTPHFFEIDNSIDDYSGFMSCCHSVANEIVEHI